MPPPSCSRAAYDTADAAFSLLVIFPLIVAYWSGSWKIADLYCTPHGDETFGAWLSLAIGCFVCALAALALPLCEGRIRVSNNLAHVAFSRAFNYASAWGMLFFWRGVWGITNKLIGSSVLAAGVILAVAYLVLTLLRTAQNVVGPPFVLLRDNDEDFYVSYPRFRTSIHDSPYLFILDALFTAIFIQGGCVLVWVGLWNVFDAAILPHDKFMSYIISLAAGGGGALLMFALQYPIFLLAKTLYRRGWLLELLLESALNVISVVVVLLLWRGGWGMMKDFVLTSTAQWDCWLCHGVGMAGMMLTGTSRTLGGVGCGVDGEQGDGYDVVRNIGYFWKLCGAPSDQQMNIQESSSEDEADPLLGRERDLITAAAQSDYGSHVLPTSPVSSCIRSPQSANT